MSAILLTASEVKWIKLILIKIIIKGIFVKLFAFTQVLAEKGFFLRQYDWKLMESLMETCIWNFAYSQKKGKILCFQKQFLFHLWDTITYTTFFRFLLEMHVNVLKNLLALKAKELIKSMCFTFCFYVITQRFEINTRIS